MVASWETESDHGHEWIKRMPSYDHRMISWIEIQKYIFDIISYIIYTYTSILHLIILYIITSYSLYQLVFSKGHSNLQHSHSSPKFSEVNRRTADVFMPGANGSRSTAKRHICRPIVVPSLRGLQHQSFRLAVQVSGDVWDTQGGNNHSQVYSTGVWWSTFCERKGDSWAKLVCIDVVPDHDSRRGRNQCGALHLSATLMKVLSSRCDPKAAPVNYPWCRAAEMPFLQRPRGWCLREFAGLSYGDPSRFKF